MRITDTCKCGAALTLDEKNPNTAMAAWIAWLNAHVPCRGGGHITKIRTIEEPDELEHRR